MNWRKGLIRFWVVITLIYLAPLAVFGGQGVIWAAYVVATTAPPGPVDLIDQMDLLELEIAERR